MNMSKQNYRLLLLLYAAGILILSTMPGSSLPRTVFPDWDKFVHLAEYLIFGFLAVKSMKRITPISIFFIIVGGVVFAGLDETWQSFRPGRDASTTDMVADGIGFIIGSMIASKGDLIY